MSKSETMRQKKLHQQKKSINTILEMRLLQASSNIINVL